MNDRVRLVQLTDTHLLGDPHGMLRGVEPLASLRRILRHARPSIETADALLCTGDLVNDEPAGYAHLFHELGAYRTPVLCLPGNHDDPAALAKALAAAPFRVGGHHDFGPWRIVLLDSTVPGKPGGHVARAQLDALDTALASAPPHALVCLHHHPIEMGSAWLDAVGIDNADELFEVLDAHACVRGVCWGHVHQSFDGRRRGVRLLATPSTCVQFLPLSAQFVVDGRPPAYRRLTLCADGRIETEVLWVDAAAHAAHPVPHRHAR